MFKLTHRGVKPYDFSFSTISIATEAIIVGFEQTGMKSMYSWKFSRKISHLFRRWSSSEFYSNNAQN